MKSMKQRKGDLTNFIHGHTYYVNGINSRGNIHSIIILTTIEARRIGQFSSILFTTCCPVGLQTTLNSACNKTNKCFKCMAMRNNYWYNRHTLGIHMECYMYVFHLHLRYWHLEHFLFISAMKVVYRYTWMQYWYTHILYYW